jgi:hypothetical protein
VQVCSMLYDMLYDMRCFCILLIAAFCLSVLGIFFCTKALRPSLSRSTPCVKMLTLFTLKASSTFPSAALLLLLAPFPAALLLCGTAPSCNRACELVLLQQFPILKTLFS